MLYQCPVVSVLLGCHVVRYDSEHVYVEHTRTPGSPLVPVAFTDTPRCVLQRNSANHSRAYSDACHNERRATFCFGPVGRKYRPFWIFNFQRSSKPLRAPPPSACPRSSPFCFFPFPLTRRASALASSNARVRKSVGCTHALYDEIAMFLKKICKKNYYTYTGKDFILKTTMIVIADYEEIRKIFTMFFT